MDIYCYEGCVFEAKSLELMKIGMVIPFIFVSNPST